MRYLTFWITTTIAAVAVTLGWTVAARGQPAPVKDLSCPAADRDLTVVPLLGGIPVLGVARSNAVYTISWSATDEIAQLQERKRDGGFVTVSRDRHSTSKTFVKLCEDCEGVWEYRLRYCTPPEPGVPGSEPGDPGFCSPFGEICTVTVDHPDNFVLTTAQVPECTEDQLTTWQETKEFSQDVAGRDPAGEHIGPAVAYRRNPPHGLNWYPVDSFKHTLCGSVHHFDIHDGMSAEFDFNHFIIPNSAHAFILEDVKLIADPDDVYDCAGTDNCVEVEITPPEDFFSNPWFYPREAASGPYSSLIGSNLCVYGPWVWEEAHGNRPEIHPSELYWWSRLVGGVPGGPRRYYLMLLQDDSNRFDRKENFDVSDPPPGWWRPWSAFPRTGEFKIAFELNPIASSLSFGIREVEPWKKNVVTARDPPAFEDADDGKEHAIEYHGRIVLTAKEMQPRDDDIGVRFVDVCRNATDTRLQGYISITSKVGTSDRGGEGYHVIRVGPVDDPIDSAPSGPTDDGEDGVVPPPGRWLPRARVIENSLRRDTSGGSPRLLIDIDVQIGSNSDLPATEVTVSEVYLVAKDGSRKRPEFSWGDQANRIQVQNVPVASVEATHIELTGLSPN